MTTVWSRSSGKYKTLRNLKILYRVVYTVPYISIISLRENPKNIVQPTRDKREYIECAIKFLCVLEHHLCARPIIARLVPVSLLYRTLEKFSGLLTTFYCAVRLVYTQAYCFSIALYMKIQLCFQLSPDFCFACVPIDNSYSSDVQQSIENLLLYCSVAKWEFTALNFIVLKLMLQALTSA